MTDRLHTGWKATEHVIIKVPKMVFCVMEMVDDDRVEVFGFKVLGELVPGVGRHLLVG